MRAAVYYSNHDIRIEEIPVPGTGPGEILVRVESCGICGSDVMEWYRRRSAPRVLGHEIAGVVERTGDGVEDFSPGDRVFASHHVPCNECRYCLRGMHSLCDTLRSTNFDPGGFSQYVRVPDINAKLGTFIIPDGMTFDEGTFIEPLACVVRGARIARFRAGDHVLILGSGISGLLFIKMLRSAGAGLVVTTDPVPSRREAAVSMGADASLDPREATPERLREILRGRGPDIAVVCAGVEPVVEQAVRSVDRGGTILLFAPLAPEARVPLPLYEIWRQQLTIVSTYAGCPEDFPEAIRLLETGAVRVTDMITHRLPLGETKEGFRLTAQQADSIKVIVHPQE